MATSVTKEFRALFSTWLACGLATGAAAFSGDRSILLVSALAYGLGTVALGAQSIGHEYSNRTLALLLSQPSRRERLLLVKLGVLFVMVGSLSVVAWLVIVNNGQLVRNPPWHTLQAVTVVGLSALFVAPALTMISRSTLAGIVFTVAVPLLLVLVGNAWFFWLGLLGVCAIGAVAGWRLFTGLEAIEGRGAEVHLPTWSRRLAVGGTATRAGNPVTLLVRKELRLQQLTFVVFFITLVGWVLMAFAAGAVPNLFDISLTTTALLYAGCLSALIGSLASAEERQLGTSEWHALLPMPAWKQWALKAGVALGLAILLGVGVPAVLDYFSPVGPDMGDGLLPWVSYAVLVVLLTSSTLYVSSLSTSGVRALVLSIPFLLGAPVVARIVLEVLARFDIRPGKFSVVHTHLGRELLSLGLLAGLAAFLLFLGMQNHRTADRQTRRVVAELTGIAGVVALAMVAAYLGL
jgi:hypothetical protein